MTHHDHAHPHNREHEHDHGRAPGPLDLAAIRSRLAEARGPRYWRGLEELAESEEFFEYLHREFPRQAGTPWTDGDSRRQFLRLMAASLALAGVSGCSVKTPERIVPYVKAPEELVPGKPLYFSTAMTLGGFATGLVAESHEGRPTKLEGNGVHPASLGSTDPYGQAAILTLYDPDRSQAVTRNARPSTWQDFQAAMLEQYGRFRSSGGAGLRLLTEPTTSPTLAHQIRGLLEVLPEARWHQYEPVHRDNARAGAMLAFGEDVQPRYDVARADIILSLDADFLSSGPGRLAQARAFGERRDPDTGDPAGMNRLYAVECSPTLAGAKADHRLPLAASRIGDFALALAAELGLQGTPAPSAELPEEATRWIGPLARDLRAHEGACLVLAGEGQPPLVHALAHALNDALGNVGRTVTYSEPVLAGPVEGESVGCTESLRELVDAMEAGQVEMLVILGGNPAYDAPADIPFKQALLARWEQGEQKGQFKVPLRVHNGLYLDETGVLCQWHVPQAHFLESWGDAKAFDGTVSIQQPLIEPLFGGRSALQVVAALRGERDPDGRALLEDFWRAQLGFEAEEGEGAGEAGQGGDDAEGNAEALDTGGAGTRPLASPTSPFRRVWRNSLEAGLLLTDGGTMADLQAGGPTGTTLPAREVQLRPASDWEIGDRAGPGEGLELVFAPDPTIYDGRFANNAWLQELPKPITKLTWDNALMVSPSDARERGLSTGDVVALTLGRRTLDVAVWVQPGQAEGAVTLHLGYGRERPGHVGQGTGVNAYRLRMSGAPWIAPGAELSKTGRTYALASTQFQGSLEGRNLVREASLEEYREHPDFVRAYELGHGHEGDQPSIYPEYEYNGYAWGMTIDLNRCIGCATCVVACQAENNIPTVGKEEVILGRAMHWLELDRYYSAGEGAEGPVDMAVNPDMSFQPRLCMHCEKAPCEPVCPVAATVHDHEGINNMVYNRCVGTRYCGNNCPYKVRHFNYLDYNDFRFQATSRQSDTSPLALLMNPDVTVRSRGVMEKCTYCIQRINKGKIQAELEDRTVADGEIVTACQQACPTRAIVFGDINDQGALVRERKESPRNYGLLTELNTQPRTSYLAMVKNPNPEIEAV